MMEILDYLALRPAFSLLIAPPSSGKTSFIIELYVKCPYSIVYLSPLKAINAEFHARVKHLKHVYDNPQCNVLHELSDKYLAVFSVEKCETSLFPLLEQQKNKVLIILDEFHLFYYWGESFRPHLWEVCMGLVNCGAHVIGMSATMSQINLQKCKEDFSLACDWLFLLDYGNGIFKLAPKKIHYFFKWHRSLFFKVFHKILNNELVYPGTLLFFCQYRFEVDRWVDYCQRNKIKAIGCVGGEVDSFRQALVDCPRPRCLFATICLSHGVNLPVIRHVFIGHAILNYDFWLQMAARGGRDGVNPFEIYTFDKFLMNRSSFFKAILKSLLALCLRY